MTADNINWAAIANLADRKLLEFKDATGLKSLAILGQQKAQVLIDLDNQIAAKRVELASTGQVQFDAKVAEGAELKRKSIAEGDAYLKSAQDRAAAAEIRLGELRHQISERKAELDALETKLARVSDALK